MNSNSQAQQVQGNINQAQAKGEAYQQNALAQALAAWQNAFASNPNPASTWAPVKGPSFAGQPKTLGGGTTTGAPGGLSSVLKQG